MSFFNGLVDIADSAVRVHMRLQGYISRHRQGTTFFGAIVKCDIRDFIQRRIYFFRIYEPNLTYYFMGNVRPGDVFVDLGANIGYFSLLASQMVGPAGQVISIEASPETHQTLVTNLNRNSCENVIALNVAATEDFSSVEIFNLDRVNIGANVIKAGSPGTGSVEGKPILAILGEKAPKVNFIKIDIEGSEGPILEDILENLDRFSSDLVVIAEIAKPSARFVGEFRKAGFRTFALPNNYRIGYLLVREYLTRSAENKFCVTIPVNSFSEEYTDYIFDRRIGA
jgi:FkbM family methyltransferase